MAMEQWVYKDRSGDVFDRRMQSSTEFPLQEGTVVGLENLWWTVVECKRCESPPPGGAAIQVIVAALNQDTKETEVATKAGPREVPQTNVPVTQDGIHLTSPEEGFIIEGNIYVSRLDDNGRPSGGLVGGADYPVTVKTKLEMLIALGYTQHELRGALDVFQRRGMD
jgi:hypothetical protein